jgi:hypothetical protein
MKERTLLKVALTCTIAGIITLLVLSEIIEIDFHTINEIKQMQDGEIRTSGTIEKIMQKGNVTIITLARKETIDVVIFDKVDFSKDEKVEVIGDVEEYNGKKEIIGNYISII